jgi:hypothetical protein
VRMRHITKRPGLSDSSVAHEFLYIVLVGTARLRVVDVGEPSRCQWHVGQLMEGYGRQCPRSRRSRHKLFGTLQIV